MSEWVKIHQPCPCGKSSDAYCVNDRGWGTCFSCDKTFNESGEESEAKEEFKFYGARGIDRSTFEKYNVPAKMLDEVPVEHGFVYPAGTVQTRSLIFPKDSKRHFRIAKKPEGGMKSERCFGSDIFPPGGKRIIITEGCYDALASWEMLQIPSLGVMSSSSAFTQVGNDHAYINSFDKVYIVFDPDDSGQEAAKKVASLFDFDKVYNVKLTEYKDPNEYLKQNKVSDYAELISNARRYSPDNVISGFDQIRAALEAGHEEQIGTWPFKKLNDMLFGMFREDIILITAETGIGKTEIFRAIQYHLLNTEPKAKMAITHLEEGNDTTIRGIATYADNFPYIHKRDNSSYDDIMKAYEKVVKEADRVHLYQSYDFEDDQVLLDTVRYLASVCGVNFVFLDHISWLATGGELSEDERRKLDRISQKIKVLARELHICFLFISHVNDDGRTRGSRNMEKIANTHIEITRDKNSSDPDERNKLYMYVKKGRGHGTETGPAGFATYNRETLVLEDQPEGLDI